MGLRNASGIGDQKFSDDAMLAKEFIVDTGLAWKLAECGTSSED